MLYVNSTQKYGLHVNVGVSRFPWSLALPTAVLCEKEREEERKKREGEMLVIPSFFANYYVRNVRALKTRDTRRRSGN